MLACKSIIRDHLSKNTQQYAPAVNTDDVAILRSKTPKNKLNSSLIERLFTEECEMPALWWGVTRVKGAALAFV